MINWPIGARTASGLVQSSLFALILIPFSLVAQPANESDKTPVLQTLKLDFQAARQALSEPERELQEKYEAQLKKLLEKSIQAGDLKKVLRIKRELANYKDGGSLPVSDDFPELQRLRRIYDQARQQREQVRLRKLAEVVDRYREQLLKLRTTLTKQNRVDEAVKVNDELEAIADIVPDYEVVESGLNATKAKPFENSLGMKFVPVPGTDVLFCIHETRWRDYEVYANRSNNVASAWKNQTYDGFTVRDNPKDHPVAHVSWGDAKSFCKWLSEEEGRTYRLPTDREWSAAVGIGDDENWSRETTPQTVFKPQDVFPWGKDWPPPEGAGNYSDQSRKEEAPDPRAQYLEDYDDGFPTTAPVMRFEPSRFGLYDLGGNVWEWCEDWLNSSNQRRVLRGGSWCDAERRRLLSSFRPRSTPQFQFFNYGFRIVVVPSSLAP